jgi:hypothetical protein
MRRLTAFAGALAAALPAAGPAAAQPPIWQGDMFITSATQACATSGAAVADDFFTAVYRPNITGQSQESLALFSGRAAWLLNAIEKSLRGRAVADSHVISSDATIHSSSATVVLRIAPATIAPTTRVVTISGTLTGFFNNVGCDVGVSAALGLRP